MTIAAGYLTSEGIVFGTDSTTTISTKKGVAQLFNYAQKIFEVGENSRFGVCTWGGGSVQGVSHRTLIARLADKLDLKTTKVREAVDTFKEIVSQVYENGTKTAFVGYLLGGWDPDEHVPECYQLTFDSKTKGNVEQFSIGEGRFLGCPEFFSRVFHGFDSKLPSRILNELKKVELGVPEKEVEKAFNEAYQKAVIPLAAIGFADLPIREAIDFVHTYLHITIKAFKFRFGPPICGGPIEIAFVSTDRKFRWVLHKEFDRAIYEQEP